MNELDSVQDKVRVFLVEDHTFSRDGLRATLARDARLEVVGEAASGEDALVQLAHTPAHVVVMDIGLPGINGIETTRSIKANWPSVHVVMLTAHRLESEILASLASGADAYCLKSTDPKALPLAVHAAALGSTYLDPEIAHFVLNRAKDFGETAGDLELSRRELEVLRLISEGRSNREIADTIHTSVATVKTTVQDVLAKLSASDRTQAAVKALRMRLI